MTLVREFDLFLTAGRSLPLLINVNQFDSGEEWHFTLYKGDGTQYIPSTGAIVGIKSDGLGIINSGTVVDGKVVIVETQQMTAAVGKATFELTIDSGTHGTANFNVLVEPKPGNNADLSESDLSLIQEALNAVSPLPTGGTVGQVLTKTAQGSAWSDAGTPTQAQVAEAVSDWADENITVTTGVVIDQSLSVQGAAADAKKTGDEILELKSSIQSGENVSDEFINMASVQLESGKYISNFSTGAISNNIEFSLSDFIDIPEGTVSVTVNRIVIKHDGSQSYPQNNMVCFYTSDETALGAGAVTIAGDYITHAVTYSQAKKMRINFPANFNPVPFVKVTKYRALRYVTFSSENQTVDSFTETGMYLIASNYTNAPVQGAGILTVKKTQFGGTIQEYQTLKASGSRIFHRASDNLGVFTDWREVVNADIVGLPYSTTKTFNVQDTIITEYTVKANQKVKVELGYPRIGRINVFGYGNTENYKSVMPFMDGVEFQNDDQDRALSIYNPNGELGEVKLTIYPIPSEFCKPRKYIVAKNSAYADYTSLTQCLLDLKDDHSNKIIEIWSGEYDIYQEYRDANVPVYTGDSPATEYFDYCVWVPENTHIIGKGIVRLKWMPTKANNPEITWKQCYAVSPLNVATTATIENIEIHCKNGRYCIHNDPLGKEEFTGAIQIYKNVKCYKYVNEVDSDNNQYGSYHTIGFGIDKAMRYEYHDCLFKNESIGRAFYGHSRDSIYDQSLFTELDSSEIVLNNCICDTEGNVCVKLGNSSNSNLHIKVGFNNCYFSGLVQAINEGTGSALSNVFDVTYLNCGSVNMQITDTNNRYPPKAYRTDLNLSN